MIVLDLFGMLFLDPLRFIKLGLPLLKLLGPGSLFFVQSLLELVVGMTAAPMASFHRADAVQQTARAVAGIAGHAADAFIGMIAPKVVVQDLDGIEEGLDLGF